MHLYLNIRKVKEKYLKLKIFLKYKYCNQKIKKLK